MRKMLVVMAAVSLLSPLAIHAQGGRAALEDERAVAVLAEIKSLVPNKPIRYVINSHHHFDHSGGLRAFAAEGVTVITHEINRTYFERTLAARLRPAGSAHEVGQEGNRGRRA
jgi:glyoxylase-like metal-dependent hydrolase (beta-lactamase superfamily II)